MSKWFFPSRGYGEIEGFSNPGLEMFKGAPLRAMAREICQNSLDAKRKDKSKVRIEFQREFIDINQFPGMTDLKNVLEKCKSFWIAQGDKKTIDFVNSGLKLLSQNKMFILRISDYNTTGLLGAFDDTNLTPWKSLVQGNAFSLKSSDSAAGSYGIGKAAPFVVSQLQTVFYRTLDEQGTIAAQGVTHLVSFQDEERTAGNEDPIRRSTGYYGGDERNKPLRKIELLDQLNKRGETGTDLFVPGFDTSAHKLDDWKDDIIIELLENFLYAIYSGKLEVTIDDISLNKSTLNGNINKLLPKTKNVKAFYQVIDEDKEDVIEETKKFYEMGTLKLRLLYGQEMNKKVLVVRNSGMKIATIPKLPRGISYTGFLELQGEKLNSFFRGMEDPKHSSWEPGRHENPNLAKKHKETVENWVRDLIGEKIKEISGEEMDLNVGDFFNATDKDTVNNEEDKRENIVDKVKNIDIIQDEPVSKKFKVQDLGGSSGQSNSGMTKGTIDDKGKQKGHRTRTGVRNGQTSSGRSGYDNKEGSDNVYEGFREVYVSARIINRGNGVNRLIFTTEEYIRHGELEIVTMGENGKPFRLVVKHAVGENIDAYVEDGHLIIKCVGQDEKSIVEFQIQGNQTYAMGVRAYGD